MTVINFERRIRALEEKRRTGAVDAQERMGELIISEVGCKLTIEECMTMCDLVFDKAEEERYEHPLYIAFWEAVNLRLQKVTDAELEKIGRLSEEDFWELRRNVDNGAISVTDGLEGLA